MLRSIFLGGNGGGFRERDGVDVCGVGGSGGEYISANICHSWKL